MSRREIVDQEVAHIEQQIQQVLLNYPNKGYELWCSMNNHNPKFYSSRTLYVAALKEQIKRLKASLSED